MIFNQGIVQIVDFCSGLTAEDDLLILYSPSTSDIAFELFHYVEYAYKLNSPPKCVLCNSLRMHGDQPSQDICDLISKSSILISLCQFSLAHSPIVSNSLNHRLRLLSLPDYSYDVLNKPSVRLAPFSRAFDGCQYAAKLFDGVQSVRVSTYAGTNLTFSIAGRTFNLAPGTVSTPGDLSSPPDIEINIAPVENSMNGTLVVDGSIPIPAIGKLTSPVKLYLKDGLIDLARIKTSNKNTYQVLLEVFSESSSRTIGEFGIGLNPYAVISDSMLESEGAFGTCHFGFGRNISIGGHNESSFHTDLVVKAPSIYADDRLIDPYKTFLHACNPL